MSAQPVPASPFSLASLDPRARFGVLLLAACVVALMAHGFMYSWLYNRSRTLNTRLNEVARMERIVTQTWWIDEQQKAEAQVTGIKQRFWRAKTIGLVRADIERFVQDVLAQNALKATSILVDTKVTESNDIAMLRAQLKVDGPTTSILKMLDDLAFGKNEIYVAGAIIRFRTEQALSEITLDAPTIIEQEKAQQ